MSRASSPSSGRSYGTARVCQLWEVPRSTVYARRARASRPAQPAGRPGCRARLFHVQYPRYAVRCQRMTVSGCTITRVERRPGQYRESHDQKRRSAGFVRVRAR